MKLELWCFSWKLSFFKTLEITSPLKSGPHGTQPLIYYTINHQNRRLLWSTRPTLPKTNRVRVWDVKRHFYELLFLSRSMTQNSWTANARKWFSIHKIVLEPWTLFPSSKHVSLKALRPPLSKIPRYRSSQLRGEAFIRCHKSYRGSMSKPGNSLHSQIPHRPMRPCKNQRVPSTLVPGILLSDHSYLLAWDRG
jgi:hypothetical protein